MATLAKLMVALGLDATDYQKGLAGVEGTTGEKMASIGKKLGSIGDSMTKTGRTMTAGVTLPLVALGAVGVNAASDLEESMNKVQVVFGDAAGEVIAFSDNAALALGQSQQQALEATGTFGNLFTSMGLGQEASADMSTSIVTLASDLASFNNVLPEDALLALRAGLVGEVEPLRRFGVNLSAAAVGAKALEMGLADAAVDMTKVQGLTLDLEKAQAKAADAMEEYGEGSMEARQAQQELAEVEERLQAALAGSVGELTPAQKAQAAYALILEQTTNAQGDFARTSEGLANQTRIMKAQFADAAATMGGGLLPVGLRLVNWVNDLLSKFQGLSPGTQRVILILAALAAGIGPLLIGLGSLVGAIGTIMGAFSGVAAIISGPVMAALGPIILVIGLIVGAILLFKAAWDNNWFGIRDTLIDIWENKLKPAFETVKQWLSEFIPQALAWLSNVWNTVLLPAITTVWNFISVYIIPIFTSLARVAGAILQKAIEILAGIWENVLKPAFETVWDFISVHVIPIFKEIANVAKNVLGKALNWLKTHVLDPVGAAFEWIGGVIQDIVGWLGNLANAISNIKLPSWMTPGSPTPLEMGLRGINAELDRMASRQVPRLEQALGGLSGVGVTLAGNGRRTAGAGAAAVGGDTIVIHNHNPLAAALTTAMVEDRRRARLNASM